VSISSVRLRLEPIGRSNQRDRAASALSVLGAGRISYVTSADAAAIERSRQFIEFGELFDTLVASLSFCPALIYDCFHRMWRNIPTTFLARWSDEHQQWSQAQRCSRYLPVGIAIVFVGQQETCPDNRAPSPSYFIVVSGLWKRSGPEADPLLTAHRNITHAAFGPIPLKTSMIIDVDGSTAASDPE